MDSSWRQRQIGVCCWHKGRFGDKKAWGALEDRGTLESQGCTWRHWVHKETLRCTEACWEHRVALGDYKEHRGVLGAQEYNWRHWDAQIDR